MTSLLFFKSMLFAKALKIQRKRTRMKSILHKTKTSKMCRICNEETANIPIFENINHINIPDEVKKISGVVINKADNLPNHICQSCLDLLNGCILFREMCQKTDKKLIEFSIKKEFVNAEDTNDSSEMDQEDSQNIPSPESSELWNCSTCTRVFVDLTTYNGHLNECSQQTGEIPKVEENKKTFLCDICGKIAKSNANLLIHMGIHENVFPFKCDVCPYQGRTMDLLKVHKRTHLTDKPFKCSLCAKSTTTASNLSKHMRHVHSKTRPYKCTYCEKAFSYQHDMNRHIRDIHLRQGTVECDICCKKFNTKKILQGHRWKIHKIKGERHGRLPSYLQCQIGDNSENKPIASENIKIQDAF
ncbi:zinc finger protein 480-like [Colias croceus]|uniref:zinc finger protein 480-like n=1 Tax=Colias crocea TaxID=72248 RepID=UPI001E27F6B8|nr:zinc finger protein 480-like [Colias croceus]